MISKLLEEKRLSKTERPKHVFFCQCCNRCFVDEPIISENPLEVQPCPYCGNNKYDSSMTRDITYNDSHFFRRIKKEFLLEYNKRVIVEVKQTK